MRNVIEVDDAVAPPAGCPCDWWHAGPLVILLLLVVFDKHVLASFLAQGRGGKDDAQARIPFAMLVPANAPHSSQLASQPDGKALTKARMNQGMFSWV